VHVGERRVENTRIRVLSYGPDHIDEREVTDANECVVAGEGITWVAVSGLHDVDAVRAVGECFGLHPLVLEDILDTSQRPKVEIVDEYLVCIARAFSVEETSIEHQQVTLVLRPPFVISFEECAEPLFDPVRARIEAGLGRVRGAGPDYLLYALLDAVVDSPFIALEQIGDETELVEEAVVGEPGPETLREIHRLRSEVALIRHAVGPMREAVGRLGRGASPLIGEDLELFLRDVHDHVIQVAETTEGLRDTLVGMLDTYLSSASNRMNEVMKVLTMIATIFIPATFVAGVYRMNFDEMPGLHAAWGYPVTLGVMLAFALGMLVYFRRKRWL